MPKKTFLETKKSKEDIFKLIFDNANDGLLLADSKSMQLFLGNNKICQMLGYSHKELVTLRVNDIHPAGDLPYVLRQFRRQVRREIQLAGSLPIKKKDGQVFYADVNTSCVKLAGKNYLLGIFRVIEKQKKTVQEILAEKARNDAILHSIGEGLIIVVDVDKGGRIAFVNSVFEETTGWKLHEVLNKSVVEVLPREDKYGNQVLFKERIISKVLSGQKVVADLISPFYYVRKDKSKFPVASVITPVIVENKIVGAVETFRDISKESESDKAKTEFTSLVSHQLRTPFATINWYIELLLAGDVGLLNQKQTEYLQEVYKASKRMVSLINVLLSISRIQMGTTLVEKKMIDVAALARTIVDEERPNIKDKNLEIAEVYDKNLPKIMADSKQLTMIIQNLINNAIKYSFKRGKIRLALKRQGTDILITVEDSGIGIPKVGQPKIFERFFRAENAKALEPEGIGLGLYIVKEVVGMMKGKIWFKSREDKSLPAGRHGTTFYVTIPIK
jgi:PAS domain S-box-containing protein